MYKIYDEKATLSSCTRSYNLHKWRNKKIWNTNNLYNITYVQITYLYMNISNRSS